jgi:hypothetical protein
MWMSVWNQIQGMFGRGEEKTAPAQTTFQLSYDKYAWAQYQVRQD